VAVPGLLPGTDVREVDRLESHLERRGVVRKIELAGPDIGEAGVGDDRVAVVPALAPLLEADLVRV